MSEGFEEVHQQFMNALSVPVDLLKEPDRVDTSEEVKARTKAAAEGLADYIRCRLNEMSSSRMFFTDPTPKDVYENIAHAQELERKSDGRWPHVATRYAQLVRWCRVRRARTMLAWVLKLEQEGYVDVEKKDPPTEEEIKQQVLIFRMAPGSLMEQEVGRMVDDDRECRQIAAAITGSADTAIGANCDGEIIALGSANWRPSRKVWRPAKVRLKDGAYPLWSPDRSTKEGKTVLARLRAHRTITETRLRAMIGCAFGIKVQSVIMPVSVVDTGDAGWVYVFPMVPEAFDVAKKYGLVYIPAPGQEPPVKLGSAEELLAGANMVAATPEARQ